MTNKNKKYIEVVPKVKISDSKILSLVYTPGVAQASLAIKADESAVNKYTNRPNRIGIFSTNYEKSLNRAIYLKEKYNIDAYPFEVCSIKNLYFILKNLEVNFAGYDLTLIDSIEVNNSNSSYKIDIPILLTNKEKDIDILKYFNIHSKDIRVQDNNIEDLYLSSIDIKEASLKLREQNQGVVKTKISKNENNEIIKPVAIVSDGSAVLGLGDIGASCAIPVMEGKACLFKELGNVNAISLCLKTQNSEEIIEIVKSISNSFSGINLEDIKAPKCFDIEKELIESLDIPVFHDDQHGTAIVVLAGLINALKVVKKDIDKIKIAFSGAGAAAQAVVRLLLDAGVKDISLCDINGVVYKGRECNDIYLDDIANYTNLKLIKGGLKDIVKDSDVFIGLSAPNILTLHMIESMNEKPIIFALANPEPEIDPKKAIDSNKIFILATGRSDYANQINNSLAFPGLFRGVLESKKNKITKGMKLESAYAIASLINDNELSRTNIIPNALDLNVPIYIAEKINLLKD